MKNPIAGFHPLALVVRLRCWRYDSFLSRLPQARSWLWFAGIAIAGFLAYYWDATAPRQGNDANQSEDRDSASTFIPAGFVLVPIEIANFESLDSILGKFGIVDLYLPSENPRSQPRKVAEHVKILRAPLNPSHFAVLVRDSDSPRLVSQRGPFIVVVQNPNQSAGMRLVNANSAPNGQSNQRSRITVEVNHAESFR